MAYTIKISASVVDESGKIVPGHDFNLEIPNQTEEAVDTFVNEFSKFGMQMWKKARHGK